MYFTLNCADIFFFFGFRAWTRNKYFTGKTEIVNDEKQTNIKTTPRTKANPN